MRILLLCLMFAISSPAFGLDYATFAPVPLCSPGYETFAPTPIAAPSAPVQTQPQRSGYPVRGSHWSYPGNSRADIIAHLQSGEHRGKFNRAWLESLSYQQLLSLHDDDHEHRVRGAYINGGSLQPGSVRVQYQVPRRPPGIVRILFQSLLNSPRSSGGCPGGNCPN